MTPSFSADLVKASEDPEVAMDMKNVWSLFEKHFPASDWKDALKVAFQKKIRLLGQDVSMGMNMTRHKILDKTSFVLPKKKKSDKKSSGAAKLKQQKITEVVKEAPKKKNQPKISAGPSSPGPSTAAETAEKSSSDWSSSSSESMDEEDMDALLREHINNGFCN